MTTTPDPTRPADTAGAAKGDRGHGAAIGLPLVIALILIAGVWIGGAVWSFAEQTAYAEFKHFKIPELLPLVIDGLAVAMAAVAWAASLDGRAAILARLGTAIAVCGSAGSNAAWAWERSSGDVGTIALAVAVPVAANVAFEVLLSEIRKQVQRRRGLPAPTAVPFPRFVRLWLAPWSTYFQWRRLVLEATDLRVAFAAAAGVAASDTGPVRNPSGGVDTPANGAVTVVYRNPPQHPDTPAYPLPIVSATPLMPRGTGTLGGTPRRGSDTPGTDTPANGPDTADGTPLRGTDTPACDTPANGADTPVRNPNGIGGDTPRGTPAPRRPATPPAPPLTSNGTPGGTPRNTPANGADTPSGEGVDTPTEFPADGVLLAILRDPARVPREPGGTVPTKRAMNILGTGRTRAIRLLKAEGLYRDTPGDTPTSRSAGTPGDTPDGDGSDDDKERVPVNGHNPGLALTGVSA